VSDETCVRHNLTELCDVVTAMWQHAERTASFLEPVWCRWKFVSASSAVCKQFSTLQRTRQRHRQRGVNIESDTDL